MALMVVGGSLSTRGKPRRLAHGRSRLGRRVVGHGGQPTSSRRPLPPSEGSAPAPALRRRRCEGDAVPPGTGIASRPQPSRRMPSTASVPRSMPALSVPLLTPIAPSPYVSCLAYELAQLRLRRSRVRRASFPGRWRRERPPAPLQAGAALQARCPPVAQILLIYLTTSRECSEPSHGG